MLNDTYAKKMLRKLEAHRANKKVTVTYPNPRAAQETNRQFITVSGNDFFGPNK